MNLLESGEMYLETIHILSKKGAVRSVDVSEYMGVSKPSVSRAIGLLKEGGYVIMEKDGSLTLTEAGLEVANKIYERHRVITALLTALGVSPEVAADDACKMEHHISDESFEALKRHAEKYITEMK
ncbi:MAG: metal-dependent transcriptional regulator [Clostridia bacterium]|nr:metal-dependent transcriptional regulator [Clostridia bacterium]